METYRQHDATGLAELVSRGDATPRDLVDAAIGQAQRLNPRLNAIIWDRFEDARREANGPLPEGPFRGVPFLLKDIGANQAGLPYYAGTRPLKEARATATDDTVLGARFRAAGLITLGKTNLPELGTTPTTQPLSFGPTNNPWDLTRSPSGSSGGSAAAVAAGIVPIAHANDGGGSTRLPAAWCGLVGLKPSRGRMPNPTNINRNGAELAVTRTVRDTAAILDATHGATPADLYQAPPPARSYRDEVGRDPGTLRIALITDGGGVDVDPECVEAAETTARLLQQLGHEVEPIDSGPLFGGGGEINGRLWMAGITRRIDAIAAQLGREAHDGDFEPYNWSAAERGRRITASEWTEAQEVQQAWSARVIAAFSAFDLILTPTAGCPPMRTADLEPDPERPWKMGRTYGLIGRFTLPFNVTGQPAISLPLHWTSDGLPVGVQLVGQMFREDLLIRVASLLEEAMPWRHWLPADVG
ncbi:MAG: amidase [Dehalococcoidia bacterium]